MNSLERLLREFNIFIDQSLDFLENPVLRLGIVITLILYIICVIPKLNKRANKTFNHTLVKFIMLLVVMYLGVKDPVLALLVAIAYIMTIVQSNIYGNQDIIDVKQYKLDTDIINNISKEDKLNNDAKQDGFDKVNNGANQDDKQCDNICTTDSNLNEDKQCTPITAFSNSFNSQGLNCPMGGNGVDLFGSPF